MRLAQLARKVKVKPTDIRSFIQREFKLELDADPNIKVDDAHVDAVIKEFHVEEAAEEVVEEIVAVKEVVEEEFIDTSINTDIDSLMEVVKEEEKEVKKEVKVKKKPVKTKESKPKEEVKVTAKKTEKKEIKAKAATKGAVGISYNEDDEFVHINDAPTTSAEVEVNSNAELIAGNIEALEGLKVVGKIDLGTDKEEESETVEVVEFDENEKIELPSMETIDSEIEKLDGDVDTSSFTNATADNSTDKDKDALFADLDAAMDNKDKGVNEVKEVVNKPAAEVSENIEEAEEDSIYKNSRGFYRFTSEQRENRENSLSIKSDKDRIKKQKDKKARHYKDNIASNSSVRKKKKKGSTKKQIAKQEAASMKKEAPKSIWGKFKNWLND